VGRWNRYSHYSIFYVQKVSPDTGELLYRAVTMTPFAEQFTQLLRESGMRAQALATQAEVSAGYVSSLMSGRKSPTIETVKRITEILNLDDVQHEALMRAAALSRRYVEIPQGAHRSLFEAVHAIVERADRLQPEQLQAIRLIAQFATNEEREEKPGRKVKP
jgi:transcriptional regulator with XRE-family HTH domain